MAELGFQIREFQSGDEVQIVELLDLVFEGWPKFDLNCSPLDHWEWKYLDTPNKHRTIVLAEQNGTIIGVDHNIYLRIKTFNNILECSQGTDTATHPCRVRSGSV